MSNTLPAKCTALVLAAARPGPTDPLAAQAGLTHKCMLPINGIVMLERVITALLDSDCCQQVYISIDEFSVVTGNTRLAEWLATGQVVLSQARGNLADSVLAAISEMPRQPWPVLITTADNALHDTRIIRDFVTGMLAEDSDAALGITREEDIIRTIPESGLAFHRVRDGGFSSCNLYALKSAKSLQTVEIFRTGGQFGKKHWRILKAFGIYSFFLYTFRLINTDGIIRRIGNGFGLQVTPVFLPYDYGPIDVDSAFSFALSENLLKQRECNHSTTG